MIDITTESLIAVGEVPRHLPVRSTGRRVHIATVYRWIQRGVRGVRLASIRIGGTTYTSLEAVQRFSQQLSTPKHDRSCPQVPIPAARQRQIDQATRELRSLLPQDKSDRPTNRSESDPRDPRTIKTESPRQAEYHPDPDDR